MIDRRTFLKLGGLTAAGVALVGVAEVASTRSAAGSQDGKFDPGKKWGLAIDMSKCQAATGCRDCMAACHTAHNIPDIPNPDEEIKWIWPEDYAGTFPGQGSEAYLRQDLKEKQFPVLCNHCENPACVRVCPTQATYKRTDGIVMMDYHRCIGCRYCMAACPYGARSFNFQNPRPYVKEVNPDYPTREKGVVEKCTLCVERLAQGLEPACLGACKHGALIFGDLNDPGSSIRKALSGTYAIRRRPELGTEPKVYYLAGPAES
jgi:molybdopterin-containing oxidoreductase family iron-sulfur binding subunit